MTFSDKITALMKDRRVTAKELSEKLSIGKNQFKYWADKGNTPSAETVSKIADYFGVSVDYLIGNTDDPSPERKKPVTISDELWDALNHNPKAVEIFEMIVRNPWLMDVIDNAITKEEK